MAQIIQRAIMKNFQAYPISPAALIGPILGMGEEFSLGKMQFMSDTANTAGQMGSRLSTTRT